jgi:hypothetical protein
LKIQTLYLTCSEILEYVISDDELKRLCNTHLNSREVRSLAAHLEGHHWPRKQVRNTVVIARKITIKHESKVFFSHLRQAVAASKEFLGEFNGPDTVRSMFF